MPNVKLRRNVHTNLGWVACASLLLMVAGCRERDITVSRVPKDPNSVAEVPEANAAAAQGPSGVHWQVPAGWAAQATTGMRAASFLAPGEGGANADVSVVTFAGEGGDVLANINRWRGQLKLAPTTAGELPAEVVGVDAPAGRFNLADISSAPADAVPSSRILGAWLEQPGRVWFFKMMGPASVVATQREAFLGFLRSVTPEAAADASSSPSAPSAAAPVANTNDLPHPAFMVAASSAADLSWQAPGDWRPKPASSMRKGSYTVSGGGGDADLSITAFPGDVGGLAANVNRWRGQVGLQPVDDADVGALTQAIDANGLHFTVVDFAGPDAPGQQRILSALVSWQGATWFFKMTGPSAMVEDEKPAFLGFLGSVRPSK
jgi:hypothetical protein